VPGQRLFLPVPRDGFHGLYLELKKVRGGRVSPEQRDFLAFVREQGYRAEVCKGWQEAWGVLSDYLAAEGCEQMREAA
jgi:VRR-NUC domain.